MALLKWCAALILSIWASLSASVHLLVMLMCFDFLSGLAAGWVEHKLESDISRRGIVKKGMMLVVVGVTHMVSQPLGLSIDLGAVVALAYVANEVISIFENAARCGAPIPDSVLARLGQFKHIRVARDARRTPDTGEAKSKAAGAE